eukprot:1194936-Prorocentrum_minimum.AAC.5
MSQGALAPGLARKVKKVLETRIDNPELSSSLNELSNVCTENTVASRRALRSNIEKRGVNINEEFLQVAEAAQSVGDRDPFGLRSARLMFRHLLLFHVGHANIFNQLQHRLTCEPFAVSFSVGATTSTYVLLGMGP